MTIVGNSTTPAIAVDPHDIPNDTGGKAVLIHVVNLDGLGHYDKAKNASLQTFGAAPNITAAMIQNRSYPVGFGDEQFL